MKNLYLLIALFFVFSSCKKDPDGESDERYGSTKLVYKALNVVVDSLQYNQPIQLDLNHDGNIDYYLSSVLLEYDDKPYLYLYINRKTPSLNQILVKSGEELPLNALWAVPLNEATKIDSFTNSNTLWSGPLLKAGLLNVSENENGRTFGGEWIGKKDKYLALRFEIEKGQYHYGWLRISHNVNEAKLAILDYAYNQVPEQAILAGNK